MGRGLQSGGAGGGGRVAERSAPRLSRQYLSGAPLLPRHLFPHAGAKSVAEGNRAKSANHLQVGERGLQGRSLAGSASADSCHGKFGGQSKGANRTGVKWPAQRVS